MEEWIEEEISKTAFSYHLDMLYRKGKISAQHLEVCYKEIKDLLHSAYTKGKIDAEIEMTSNALLDGGPNYLIDNANHDLSKAMDRLSGQPVNHKE